MERRPSFLLHRKTPRLRISLKINSHGRGRRQQLIFMFSGEKIEERRYEHFFAFWYRQEEGKQKVAKPKKEFQISRFAFADFERRAGLPSRGSPMYNDRQGIHSPVTNLKDLFFLVDEEWMPAIVVIRKYLKEGRWELPEDPPLIIKPEAVEPGNIIDMTLGFFQYPPTMADILAKEAI
jgi:hypothetical protein